MTAVKQSCRNSRRLLGVVVTFVLAAGSGACGGNAASQPVAVATAKNTALRAHGVGGYNVTDDSPGVADGNTPLQVQVTFVDTSDAGEPVVGLLVRASCSDANVQVGDAPATGTDGATNYTVTSTTPGMVSLRHTLGTDANAFNVHVVSFADPPPLDADDASAGPLAPE